MAEVQKRQRSVSATTGRAAAALAAGRAAQRDSLPRSRGGSGGRDAAAPSSTTILTRIESLGDPRNVAGMARYGIRSAKAYGVSVGQLRRMAREIGRDHTLALQLWKTGIHEARILALLVADPARLSERQMERWAKDFDNWAICDGCCIHLFDRTPFARRKAGEWSRRPEEFVKRAAFALMAALAVHDKEAKDAVFVAFLRIVAREADDDRNGVKKAVNWALRQIGKRDLALNRAAIGTAEAIRAGGSRSGRWIAADALRELRSEAVQRRLRARQATRTSPAPRVKL